MPCDSSVLRTVLQPGARSTKGKRSEATEAGVRGTKTAATTKEGYSSHAGLADLLFVK